MTIKPVEVHPVEAAPGDPPIAKPEKFSLSKFKSSRAGFSRTELAATVDRGTDRNHLQWPNDRECRPPRPVAAHGA